MTHECRSTHTTHYVFKWDGKQEHETALCRAKLASGAPVYHRTELTHAYNCEGNSMSICPDCAQLAGAAPDLLARLRECVDYLYSEADNAEDRNNGLIAECEDAIRKATERE